MKVTVTVPVATIKGCYLPGQEYELDDAEADNLIRAGQAAAVDKSYKPKPQPVTMDAKASTPIEKIDVVKPATAVEPAPVVTTNAALTTNSVAGPTAVEIAKKAGK